MTATDQLPLAGIRVIDFTQVMMGPVATQMLADYGADVIKIERPGTGDLSRTSFPNDPAGLIGPVYCSLNRNKRSVVLDMRKAEDKAAVLRLLETADVVVNNFRAGVMERMGFGYEELAKRNPRLIYAVGTGFGLTGPYSHKGGQDVLAQAMSGVMARRADPSLPLSVYSTTFADYSAGMHLVQGVLLALLQRQKTGRGQRLSVSLLDSMLAAQTQEAAAQLMRGREVNWGAMPLTGVFETSDGALVMVGAFKADPIGDIGKALELAELSRTIRASRRMRCRSRTSRRCMKSSASASRATRRRIGSRGSRSRTCSARRCARSPRRSPTSRRRSTAWSSSATARSRRVRVVGSPIHLEDAPVSIRIPPADLGQHTAEVLAEIESPRIRAAGELLVPIRFDVADHVARVTIDRPEVLNAIDVASERELQRIWAAIEADREVRVVVLTGAGERAFSAGADMKGGSRRERPRLLGE